MRDTIYLEDYEGLRTREERRVMIFTALQARHGRRVRWAGLLALLGLGQ
jgi:hypothetical protein